MGVSQGFVGGTYHKRLASEDESRDTCLEALASHIQNNSLTLLCGHPL